MSGRTKHASVVGVAKDDDPNAIAWAAATAGLDLLQRVTIPAQHRLTVTAVDIVVPVATAGPLDLLLGSRTTTQAVVVTAELTMDVADKSVAADGAQ